MKIKQRFHHFSKWEDFRSGLYDSTCERYEEKVQLSIDLLSNQKHFYEVATEMVNTWNYSSEQMLTDASVNKKAWIGQASCCFNHNSPDYATKDAWWKIPEKIRDEANTTATIVMMEWKSKQIMKGSLWGKED